MRRFSSDSKRAFTLFELAISLTILAVLAAMALSKMTQDTRRSAAMNMQQKMDRIETALQAFAVQNNRLPCPADGTQPLTLANQTPNTQFGVEVSTPGTCTGVNFTDGADTVGGVLPVRTLANGLADEDIFDAAGNEFAYFVSKTATAANAFATYPIYASNIGNITILDGSGQTRTSTAVVLILSLGSDGHGAFTRAGVIKSSGSTNTDQLLNCHCHSDGTAAAFTNQFVLHSAFTSSTTLTNRFDDVGRYYTRSSFINNP